MGIAIALGGCLGVLSLIWATPSDRWVSIVAGLVMSINIFIACTLGTLLPMVLSASTWILP